MTSVIAWTAYWFVFSFATVVGGILTLMGLTAIVQEPRPEGAIAITLAMGALLLLGLAGLSGAPSWPL